MSKYSIDDLDNDYVKYLYLKIPILKEENKDSVKLLQLVLDYIESTEKGKKEYIFFSRSKNAKSILQNINNSIKHIVGHTKNVNVFNNEKEFIEKNNKYVKRYNIKAIALIEGIILVTLNYYKEDFPNTEIIITNSEKSINTKKINFVMNKVKDITLGMYILNLYINKNINIKEKETIIFNLLQKIAGKLQRLQDNFSFIHGDFHSGNIFIEEKKNGFNINFIDVEYSTIKLPTKNVNKIIILTSPVNENILRKEILDINKEPNLKALDLFHLIEDIKSFDNYEIQKIIDINNMNELRILISKLSKLYKPSKLKKKIHNSTREIGFFNYTYSNLIPENFININNINNINNLKLNNLKIQSPYKKQKKNTSTPPSTPPR